MDAREKLRQIIREELRAVVKEQAKTWWHKPAEAELDGHLEPHHVHEAKEKKPRPGVGKKKASSGARFTSAGTIPPVKGGKLGAGQVKNREEIGKKMLNTFRRGGEVGKNFRAQISSQLDRKGLPGGRKHQYSQIWANASAMAANGATASDFPRKKKKENKPKKSAE